MKHTNKDLSEQMAASRSGMHALGERLRRALADVLEEAGAASMRPVGLARALKIDDSLAARLVRSVRAGDALSSLRELPSPQGLRLFLDAAAGTGVTAVTRGRAEEAVARFAAALEELPLGRASLNTAIDGWLPSGRGGSRAERAGKQAVFKALSQTLGFTVDTCCFAVAIAPSAAGDACDAMTFIAYDGVRRLREGAPILLLSHNSHPGHPSREGLPPPIVETLDGEREVTDARKLLLADVGQGSALPVRLIERGHHSRILLESSTPPLNVPISAGAAYVTRNQFRRFRTAECATEALFTATKTPMRVYVQDVFIHEDVYPGFMPNVVARMDGLTFDPLARDLELLDVERLEVDVEMKRIGWGLERVGVKEWGGYEGALRGAFARAKWEASRFRAYRCYWKYPMPFVSLTTWFELPGGPGMRR